MKEYGHYIAPVLSETCPTVIPAGHSLDVPLRFSEPGRKIRAAYLLEKEAALDLHCLFLPGCGGRAELDVFLRGEGARACLKGLYLCGDGDRADISIRLWHLLPGAYSDQLFKGVLAGRANASFTGRVIVAPDAVGTEAYQADHNLLLGQEARVETQPQLEIYADDVKCSHGATVGSLDEQAGFYLRSRGVPEAEAKILQMLSFVAPALEGRGELLPEVEAAIRQLALL